MGAPIMRRDVVTAIIPGRTMMRKILRTTRATIERAPMIGPTPTRTEVPIVLRMERVGPRAGVVVDLGLGRPGKRNGASQTRSHDGCRDGERRMTVQHCANPLPCRGLDSRRLGARG